ncbi:MAG: Ig-like domain-containing protein [Bacteroidales bacterium]|nr:Ig-like domain-containing protein [Candidatus Cryptobacteroides equifaecalis]
MKKGLFLSLLVIILAVSCEKISNIGSVKLNRSSIFLLKGKTMQLNAIFTPADSQTELTWATTDANVAVVSPDGVVTAVAEGMAEIMVSSPRNSALSGRCKVVVSDPKGVQLWKDGPHWATYNIGAYAPEDFGLRFQWGDPNAYYRNANDNGWTSNDLDSLSFVKEEYEKTAASKIQSDLTGDNIIYDPAHVHWGEPWRMPARADFMNLRTQCDWEWTYEYKGQYTGYVVTGRGEFSGKSIFLSAAGVGKRNKLVNAEDAGYYWTSTYCAEEPTHACELLFYDDGIYPGTHLNRSFGFPVRAVY